MPEYISSDISSLISARISPLVAKAICHITDLDKVGSLFINAPEDIKSIVRREISDLRKVASVRNEASPDLKLEAWISVQDAAVVLKKTDRTVRNYIREGRLDSRKKNKRSFEVSRISVEIMRLNQR